MVAAVNLGVFIGLLCVLELVGQTIALLYPSYEVMFLQPDKALGWKQVPNLRWTWTGMHWYAADFSVDVKTNSEGFRDLERKLPKTGKRVALIGDSLIEAVQVPFEATAGAVLERWLNEHRHEHWEVLNFGISNFGIGQYLLVWENHARRYSPDYVVLFVAQFHLERTIRQSEVGAFRDTTSRLRIRPTFRLEGDELLREDPADYLRFAAIHQSLINSEFGGQYSRRRAQLVLPYYIASLSTFFSSLSHDSSPVQRSSPPPLQEDLVHLNFRIIEELGNDVTRRNSRLVILDAAPYFEDETFSQQLKQFCARHGYGYVPLYKALLKANASGQSTRWKHDGHFNTPGNELVAKVVFNYIKIDLSSQRARWN